VVTPRAWFFADGKAISQGSKDALAAGVVRESSWELKPWRRRVAAVARAAGWVGAVPGGSVAVGLVFVRQRPATHFRACGQRLRASAPAFPDTTPDIDKLTRAILDALTAVCWPNDSRVVVAREVKVWGPRPGVGVVVQHIAGVAPGAADVAINDQDGGAELARVLDWWPPAASSSKPDR
jgi:crossover junction endodeoxyribonuclease RusA